MKPTKRQLVIDTITAAAIVAVVLFSVIMSTMNLIFRTDRHAWQIILDALVVAVFVLAATVATIFVRRILAVKDSD